MTKTDNLIISGSQLVADFQSAMYNFAYTDISAQEAKQSEALALGQLNYYGGEGVLNPKLIPEESGGEIAHASLDAHIKKVQAEQIEHMSRIQLTEMTENDQKLYAGKRVDVKVLEPDQKPIESLWFDKYKGYTNGILKTKSISGTIKEIWLEKNALLISPGFVSKTLNPGRKYYVVYIINPISIQPMVKLNIR